MKIWKFSALSPTRAAASAIVAVATSPFQTDPAPARTEITIRRIRTALSAEVSWRRVNKSPKFPLRMSQYRVNQRHPAQQQADPCPGGRCEPYPPAPTRPPMPPPRSAYKPAPPTPPQCGSKDCAPVMTQGSHYFPLFLENMNFQEPGMTGKRKFLRIFANRSSNVKISF